MKKSEREAMERLRQYDQQFAKGLEQFITESMRSRSEAELFIKSYAMAKILCNGLVCHLNVIFRGDTNKIADFISHGVNIDLGTVRKFNRKKDK
jgi:hypothetical protein